MELADLKINQDDRRWATAIVTASVHEETDDAIDLVSDASGDGILALVALCTAALETLADELNTTPEGILQTLALAGEAKID